uniref:Uncharacterized protein n=1 Tax=Ciona intestinalis TaxID=7719 RepID=F6S453_CIOIN
MLSTFIVVVVVVVVVVLAVVVGLGTKSKIQTLKTSNWMMTSSTKR